jgi:hypothetical protein
MYGKKLQVEYSTPWYTVALYIYICGWCCTYTCEGYSVGYQGIPNAYLQYLYPMYVYQNGGKHHGHTCGHVPTGPGDVS